jgi:hypothetical protein
MEVDGNLLTGAMSQRLRSFQGIDLPLQSLKFLTLLRCPDGARLVVFESSTLAELE